jgi:hypothetical protein
MSALILTAQQQPGNAVPGPLYQSLPVPDVAPEGPRVHFLYGITRPSPRGGAYLKVPSYMATIAADTGDFERMVAVTPRALGDLNHRDNDALGFEPWHRAPTPEEAMARHEQLLSDYDTLFAGLVAHSFDAELSSVARRFRELFDAEREVLLAPYYEYLGQLFFHYVDSLAAKAGSKP